MDRKITKILTFCLALVMLASMFGACSSERKRKRTADEEIILQAEKFCDAILNCDTETIEEIASDDFEEESAAKVLKYYYNNPAWEKETKDVADVLFDSLTYRVDKNSVLGSYEREEGTIDVYFSFLDYEKCMEEKEGLTPSNFAEILKKYKETTYVKVTLDFVLDKKDWLVEDYEKAFIDIFTWKEAVFDFSYDFKSAITSFELIEDTLPLKQDGKYCNVSTFRVAVNIDDNAHGYNWTDTYMYLYNGNDRIELATVYSWYGEYDYIAEFDAYYAMRADSYPSGDYKVIYFDPNGNQIGSIDISMVNEEQDLGFKRPDSNSVFTYGDSPYLEYVSYAFWYDNANYDFELDLFMFANLDDGLKYSLYIVDYDTGVPYYSTGYEVAPCENKVIEIVGNFDNSQLPDDWENLNLVIWVYDENGDLIVKAVV